MLDIVQSPTNRLALAKLTLLREKVGVLVINKKNAEKLHQKVQQRISQDHDSDKLGHVRMDDFAEEYNPNE